MEKLLHTQIHTCLYFEILHGRFQPDKVKCNKTGQFDDLYIEANMVKVPLTGSLKNHEPEIDYTVYGYKSTEHYEFIHKRNITTGGKDVYIRPTKKYVPRAMPYLYTFDSKKADGFRGLIADEFERIRIKAEKVYDKTTDDRHVILYAIRNIQKVMTLFDDSIAHISEQLKIGNFENAYIFYVLATYLIKCVSLYNHYFSVHLKNDVGDEAGMRKSLDSVLAQGCFIFCQTNGSTGPCCETKKSLIELQAIQMAGLVEPIPGMNLKKSKTGFAAYSNGSTQISLDESAMENENEAKTIENSVHSEPPRYCWNLQINVLVDMFLQITENLRHNDEPALAMTREELKDFLIRNFLDKNGKELSPYTIETLLKSYRFDKILNPDSPKRIILDLWEQ